MVMTSAINTADAIEFSRHAEGVGADCLLILPPYFEGPDNDGVVYHFEKIAGAVNVPIMVYNIPVHSGIDITPELFKRLREIENVQYIKDSTADLVRIQELLAIGANVFNGGDPIAFFSLLAGCPRMCMGCLQRDAEGVRGSLQFCHCRKAGRGEGSLEAHVSHQSVFPGPTCTM